MAVEALVKAELTDLAAAADAVGTGVGHGGHTGVEPEEGTTVTPTGRLTIPPELALTQAHPDCALVYKPPPLQLVGWRRTLRSLDVHSVEQDVVMSLTLVFLPLTNNPSAWNWTF